MFRASRLLLVSKIDLLPHLDLSIDRLVGNARRVNRALEVLEASARTGEGIEAWTRWIRLQQAAARV
jgi:hydrogenase nickel incorporation protein HypB